LHSWLGAILGSETKDLTFFHILMVQLAFLDLCDMVPRVTDIGITTNGGHSQATAVETKFRTSSIPHGLCQLALSFLS
jgi:hypothetical protein